MRKAPESAPGPFVRALVAHPPYLDSLPSGVLGLLELVVEVLAGGGLVAPLRPGFTRQRAHVSDQVRAERGEAFGASAEVIILGARAAGCRVCRWRSRTTGLNRDGQASWARNLSCSQPLVPLRRPDFERAVRVP